MAKSIIQSVVISLIVFQVASHFTNRFRYNIFSWCSNMRFCRRWCIISLCISCCRDPWELLKHQHKILFIFFRTVAGGKHFRKYFRRQATEPEIIMPWSHFGAFQSGIKSHSSKWSCRSRSSSAIWKSNVSFVSASESELKSSLPSFVSKSCSPSQSDSQMPGFSELLQLFPRQYQHRIVQKRTDFSLTTTFAIVGNTKLTVFQVQVVDGWELQLPVY